MTSPRARLHFDVFLYKPGMHSAGWDHPDTVQTPDMHFPYCVGRARIAEPDQIQLHFCIAEAGAASSAARLTSPARHEAAR